jgi:tRNA threonylcarbamoyladenosine biosynthesis protein TsaE
VDDLDLDADTATSVTVVEWGGGLVEGLAQDWLDVSITPLAGGDGDDEPRAVRLSGQGARWAAAADEVQLALAGASDPA